MSNIQIENDNRALSLPGQFSTDLLALDEKVKSMMTKSQNMMQLTVKIQESSSYDLQSMPKGGQIHAYKGPY